jgi:hypothetical protein
MNLTRRSNSHAVLMSLEAAAASARGGFGCLFSTADEYETALISERRAQGRYAGSSHRDLFILVSICLFLVMIAVLLA